MKKYYSLIIVAFFGILISSCTQKENFDDNKISTETQEEIVSISNSGMEPASIIMKTIAENPESYIFHDSNSDLWNKDDNKGLKSTTSSIFTVVGYDLKVPIRSSKVMFTKGLLCDSRVLRNVIYLYTKCQYKKMIQIPKGATLILPPNTVMASMYPMGLKPGSSSTGYECELISSNSTYDTYFLISEGNEITYNSLGQLVAPANNPIFFPCGVGLPKDFIFKYQYQEIEW